MMQRITTLAILAIAVAFSASANADDLGDQIKAAVKAKIAKKLGQKMDASGPREINNTNIVEGEDNAVNASADGSQNLTIHYREGDITYAPTDSRQWHTTTTTTDSRQWHQRGGDTTTTYAPRTASTYAPRYTEGDLSYAPRTEPRYVEPYCPPTRYAVAPRLTYSAVTDECTDVIHIRCWAACGGYFVDTEGRRFNLLASYSKVPPASRHRTLTGRYWRNASGVLMFTAIWPCGTIRTFIDP